MTASIPLIWLGALLVLASIIYTAARALGRGRLSEPRQTGTDPTLEPTGRAGRLGLAGNWPALALMAVGALLLLVGAIS